MIIIIIDKLGPSTDRSIKIARQLEQVFEPCLMIFKELKMEKGGRGGGQ